MVMKQKMAAKDAIRFCRLLLCCTWSSCSALCSLCVIHFIQVLSCDVACLREISSIISDSDVSSFEIIHSGLISKLISYIASPSLTHDQSSCRNDRLRVFLHVFANCPVSCLVRRIVNSYFPYYVMQILLLPPPPLLPLLLLLLLLLQHPFNVSFPGHPG